MNMYLIYILVLILLIMETNACEPWEMLVSDHVEKYHRRNTHKSHQRGLRIYNGSDARDGNFPFIVEMRYADTGRHECGASIISPDWIVIAAHCVHPYKPVEIIAGLYKRSADLNCQRYQVRKLHSITIHGGYSNPFEYANDLALLKLKNPLEFNKYVNSISIGKEEIPDNTECTIAGWGSIVGGPSDADGNYFADTLQTANLPSVPVTVCQHQLSTVNPDGVLCLYRSNQRTGACWGDSGGPLVCPDQNNTPLLAGAFSMLTTPCGKENGVNMYTKLSHYVEWIKDVTGLNI